MHLFDHSLGILKFYHPAQTEQILSETGTHQGNPLGYVLFSAPYIPFLSILLMVLIPYLSMSLLIMLLSSEDSG